jgi:hypothetical protein
MEEKKTDETAEELRVLEEQLNAARDRTAAADRKRLVTKKRLEVEDAILEAESAEVVAKLEDEHGPLGKAIAVLRTPGGLIAVKKGIGIVWHRFLSSKRTPKDHEDLVRACRIHPVLVADFNRLVEEFPAAVVPLAGKLAKLYGHQEEDEQGK